MANKWALERNDEGMCVRERERDLLKSGDKLKERERERKWWGRE